jgi:hypothetical protein
MRHAGLKMLLEIEKGCFYQYHRGKMDVLRKYCLFIGWRK